MNCIKVYENQFKSFNTLTEELDADFSQIGKGNVELVEEVDPELIGGFILRIGDMQIDTTVKNEIIKLKQGFKENLYVEEI
jgi:F-type H+-transporting ATPase subunit delta